MAKKSSGGNTKWLVGIIVVLLLILGFVSLKYVIKKGKWNSYSMDMQEKAMQYPSLDAEEDANMLALTIGTIGTIPSNTPLFLQPKELEAYVNSLGKQTGRDIVVVNSKGIILADSISSNIGKEYTDDKGEELKDTIKDGKTRTFTETSTDYPHGISQTVVALKDSSNNIVGAIILSTSGIFK